MDEVLADAISRFIDWYERDFGVRYTEEQFMGSKLAYEVPVEHRQTVLSYPHQPGFFKDLPVIENSQMVLEELNKRHEIYIASAAMEFKHSLYDKYEWLDKNFPFIHWKRRVMCGDKSVLKADVLIDDHDFNLSVFSGRAIMFTAPHNVHFTNYERINNWKDALTMFDL
jgi:5'(3')-deoxyribonucleotidase